MFKINYYNFWVFSINHLIGSYFTKKDIQFEKRNLDPDYFKQKILDNFPELPELANVFSLWQLRENKPELVPLFNTINNAKALCDYKELNRSCVYVRAGVSIDNIVYVTEQWLIQDFMVGLCVVI